MPRVRVVLLIACACALTACGALLSLEPLEFTETAPPVSAFVQGAWHHFQWTIVTGAMTLEVKPKAGGAGVVRTDTQPQDPSYFKLGAETSQSLGPVKMFIDDVVMYR